MTTSLQEKGLSLRKLLNATPPYFKNNAQDVVIKKLEKKLTKGGLKAIVSTSYGTESKQTLPHKQTIIGLDRDKVTSKPLNINKCKRVLAQCSCQSYLFSGAEYANWHHGAAKIIYGNGDKPVVNNPQLQFFLCKHLVKIARKVIEKDW